MTQKLYRSRSDRILFGVCGGLAAYLGMDSTVVRVIMVLLALTGAGVLLYIVMSLIVPLEGSAGERPRDVVARNVSEMKATAEGLGQELRETFVEGSPPPDARAQARRRNLLGGSLILVGVLLLLQFLGVFRWWGWGWGAFWALGLIAIGVFILLNATRRK